MEAIEAALNSSQPIPVHYLHSLLPAADNKVPSAHPQVQSHPQQRPRSSAVRRPGMDPRDAFVRSEMVLLMGVAEYWLAALKVRREQLMEEVEGGGLR